MTTEAAATEMIADPTFLQRLVEESGPPGALLALGTLCLIALFKFGLAPLATKLAELAASHRESAVEVKNAAMCSRDAAASSEQSSELARESASACERIAERILSKVKSP